MERHVAWLQRAASAALAEGRLAPSEPLLPAIEATDGDNAWTSASARLQRIGGPITQISPAIVEAIGQVPIQECRIRTPFFMHN